MAKNIPVQYQDKYLFDISFNMHWQWRCCILLTISFNIFFYNLAKI
jgi:hypothetical protein